MSNTKIEVSMFTRHVLALVKEGKRTGEEIWESYKGHHPQGLIGKTLHLEEVKLSKVIDTLLWLEKEEFIYKELTNFTDRPLKKETLVFWIRDKGRTFLLPKR